MKIYHVFHKWENNLFFEDHFEGERLERTFSTRKKAENYINNLSLTKELDPDYDDECEVTITEDILDISNERERKKVEKKYGMYKEKYLRSALFLVKYKQEDDYDSFETEFHGYYIREGEMD